MSELDRDYYRQRAEASYRQAAGASDPHIGAIHEELARLYEAEAARPPADDTPDA